MMTSWFIVMSRKRTLVEEAAKTAALAVFIFLFWHYPIFVGYEITGNMQNENL